MECLLTGENDHSSITCEEMEDESSLHHRPASRKPQLVNLVVCVLLHSNLFDPKIRPDNF